MIISSLVTFIVYNCNFAQCIGLLSMRIEIRYMKQVPENRLKYNESKTVKATLF